MLSLDIGCGKTKKFDLNVDLQKSLRPDIVCDAQYLPFKSETFDLIHCSHLLEHVDDPSQVIREIKRIAKPDAKIIIKFPRPEYASNTKYYLALLIFNIFHPRFYRIIKQIIKGCWEVQKRDVGRYHKWIITEEFLIKNFKLEHKELYGCICQLIRTLENRLKIKIQIRKLMPSMKLIMKNKR